MTWGVKVNENDIPGFAEIKFPLNVRKLTEPAMIIELDVTLCVTLTGLTTKCQGQQHGGLFGEHSSVLCQSTIQC